MADLTKWTYHRLNRRRWVLTGKIERRLHLHPDQPEYAERAVFLKERDEINDEIARRYSRTPKKV